MATRSKDIISNLQAADPGIRSGGFPAAIAALADSKSLAAAARTFIPDGYRIDHEARQVVLIEVADTHPVRPEKGEKIAALYDELEDAEWTLRVVVLDYTGAVVADVHGWAYSGDAVGRHAPENCMDATPAAKAAAAWAATVSEAQAKL